MSPMLFIVILEYLSGLSKEATSSKCYELYTMGGTKVESHLVFANDVIFFGRVSTCTFYTLQGILEDFLNFLGLTINRKKSYVMSSARVEDGDSLGAILGFQVRCLLIQHLGTPVTGHSVSHKDYDYLLENFCGIQVRWSGHALSYKEWMKLIDWVF